MSKRDSESAWRAFERVVATIEETVTPIGALVKSPDRIRDLTTNQTREVDASIRYRLGTVDILVTVECRKRSRTADVTWIEQLVTKKQKLGAAKTIAVSQKGFSKEAASTATLHGIELRSLSEITPESITQMLRPEGLTHVFPETANLSCSVRIEGKTGFIPLPDAWEPVFSHEYVRSPFPAVTLWAFHGMAHPRRFLKLPLDGQPTRVQFYIASDDLGLIPMPQLASVRASGAKLYIELNGSRQTVIEIEISADVSNHVGSLEQESGVYHNYEGPSGLIAQHAGFKGKAFGLPVEFDLAGQGREVSGFAEFPSGARLQLRFMTDELSSICWSRSACAYCGNITGMELKSILPDFLMPSDVRAKERFLCVDCSAKFEKWDEYAEKIWKTLPLDLPKELPAALVIEKLNGSEISLWLLSLLWRMGCSQGLSNVNLGGSTDEIRILLETQELARHRQFPVTCLVPSFEGKRIEFSWLPRWNDMDGVRVLSTVLKGVLFQFFLDRKILDEDWAVLVTDDSWIIPILDWQEIDYVVEGMLERQILSR